MNTPMKPPLTADESELLAYLRGHVDHLAGTIGIRHDSDPDTLEATVTYLHQAWTALGQDIEMQTYPTAAWEAKNLVVEWPGTDRSDEIVIVGAHYDTVSTTPGADDNASAVAMLLTICRGLIGKQFRRTLRFVAFANEEPPHFIGPTMGSRVYAERCKARGDNIHCMVCLEMVGFYTTAKNSQTYPNDLPRILRAVLPRRGNFIAFVSDWASRPQLRRFKRAFKHAVRFPCVAAPLPRARDIMWVSDHGPFWDNGYPALMVTDTSWFRNDNYHQMTDTPNTLDYERMARVTTGVTRAVAALAQEVY